MLTLKKTLIEKQNEITEISIEVSYRKKITRTKQYYTTKRFSSLIQDMYQQLTIANYDNMRKFQKVINVYDLNTI